MEPNDEPARRSQSSRVRNILDVTANVCIIALCAVIVVLFVRRTNTSPPAAQALLAPGDKINIASIDWRAARQTVLIVMKRDCSFCEASAPFYKTLATSAGTRSGVRVIALLPEPSESAHTYLQQLGVPITEIRQIKPYDLPIHGTPTLILVDSAGKVKRTWIGKLSPKGEEDVLRSMGSI